MAGKEEMFDVVCKKFLNINKKEGNLSEETNRLR